MKRILLLLFPALLLTMGATAQSRGIRIGYIDMDFILKSVPDYAEAKNQLEQKAQGWKQEMATKQNDINKLKESLKTERVLLTKELIEEREEEIAFQEKELLDYQQKRFGPTGDLVTQKAVLTKPIQDQVFTAAQDIAEAKKYDFIFDKSSDLTMLFAAKKFDISDQVIRVLNRTNKRSQLDKKQLKDELNKEALEDMTDNPAMEERQKKLDQKKADRDKLLEERKLAQEAKKKEFEDNRARIKAEREAKRNGTTVPAATESTATAADKTATGKTTTGKTAAPSPKTTEIESNAKTTDSTKTVTKEAAAAARVKALEDRKKAADDRRQKALEAREALKKQREEERLKAAKPKDSTKTN